MIIDNATWHNQLTEDTMPSKRAWRKDLIVQWLINHNIRVPTKATKAELLVLAFDNLSPKRYVIDERAKNHNVNILRLVYFLQNYFSFEYPYFQRLPIKHCMLNPIELGWARLKNYVRDNNVNFNLGEVRHLAYQWMTSLNRSTAMGYIRETRRIEDIFKSSDKFTEEIEEQLVDEDEEVDSATDEMED